MRQILRLIIKCFVLFLVLVLMAGEASCSPAEGPGSLPSSVSPVSPSATTLLSPVGLADYVVYMDGNTYKAVNGTTGSTDFSGADARPVIQQAINSLQQGTVWLKDLPRPGGLTMKDRVTLIAVYDGQILFYGNFGHTPYQQNEQRVMVFNAENEAAKPILEWRDYLGNKVAWIVAHYRLNPRDIHQHLSFETAKSDNTTIITRLEITYGEDIAKVSVDNSNFIVANGTTTLNGPTAIRSSLRVEGGLAVAYDTSSAPSFRLAGGNNFFAADAKNNAMIVNLPQSTGNEGRIYTIKKVDTTVNSVTVLPASGDSIDGAQRYVLSSPYKFVTLICSGTGSGWYVMGQN